MDSPINILIVDDEHLITEVLEITLQYYGFKTTSTDSGYSAINTVRAERFDIALLDIGMPAMNGIELITELRRLSPHTIIILMTAYDHYHPLVKKAITEKPDKLLHKPFDPIQLVSIIDYYGDHAKFIDPPLFN